MSLEIEARSDELDQIRNFQVLILAFVVFVLFESGLQSSGRFEVLFRIFTVALSLNLISTLQVVTVLEGDLMTVFYFHSHHSSLLLRTSLDRRDGPS